MAKGTKKQSRPLGSRVSLGSLGARKSRPWTVEELIEADKRGDWNVVDHDGVTLGSGEIVEYTDTFHYVKIAEPPMAMRRLVDVDEKAEQVISKAEKANEALQKEVESKLSQAKWALWNERANLKQDLATAKALAEMDLRDATRRAHAVKDRKQRLKLISDAKKKAAAKEKKMRAQFEAKSALKQAKLAAALKKAEKAAQVARKAILKRHRGAYQQATGLREKAISEAMRKHRRQRARRELGAPLVDVHQVGGEWKQEDRREEMLEWIAQMFTRMQHAHPNTDIFGNIRLVRVGRMGSDISKTGSPIFKPSPLDTKDEHQISLAWVGWKAKGNLADTLQAARGALERCAQGEFDALFVPYVKFSAIRRKKG